MGIAAVIGIVSSVVQLVRAFNRPDPPQAAQPQQKADKLFAELDAMGQGAIQRADLDKAFDRIAETTTGGAEKLFARLDADGDGTITKSEFSGSINRLAEQLDHQYMRLRLHGEGGPPASAADAGFTREELTALTTSIAGSFDKADANGDGRVSIREMRSFALGQGGLPTALPESFSSSQNVELMLQVVRLMQAYGVVGGSSTTADNTAQRVADKV
ncbi:MAG: EF-hand domain-containing protein [Betaproteobacteria bacterium]|nr:EF-hand domain-containing protein [Betaproteobacteria bacterium]